MLLWKSKHSPRKLLYRLDFGIEIWQIVGRLPKDRLPVSGNCHNLCWTLASKSEVDGRLSALEKVGTLRLANGFENEDGFPGKLTNSWRGLLRQPVLGRPNVAARKSQFRKHWNLLGLDFWSRWDKWCASLEGCARITVRFAWNSDHDWDFACQWNWLGTPNTADCGLSECRIYRALCNDTSRKCTVHKHRHRWGVRSRGCFCRLYFPVSVECECLF